MLYEVITAFLGAYAAIPVFGLNGSMYGAAAVNVAVGALVLVLFKEPAAEVAEAPAETPADAPDTATPASSGQDRGGRFAMLTAIFVAGLSGMLLENAWSHALVLVFGTSVYAFATMLTTYLVGIGLGSLAVSRFPGLVEGRLGGRWALVPLFALMGLSVYASTVVIGRLPAWFVSVFAAADATWTGVVAIV